MKDSSVFFRKNDKAVKFGTHLAAKLIISIKKTILKSKLWNAIEAKEICFTPINNLKSIQKLT